MIFVSLWMYLIFSCLSSTHPAPVQTIDPHLVKFMQNYGFLKWPPEGISYLHDMQVYTDGIKKMQEFHGLPITGEADEATRALLTGSRCGIPDIENGVHGGRQKRFAKHGSQWSRTELTYYIKSHTWDLPKYEVEKGVATAVQKWAAVSKLTFRQVEYESAADIVLLWATLSHGDVSAFDGPGGSLAHAFYPDAGGAVHMDDDETWTIEIDAAKHNLVQVVTHELGHSLGLRHSSDKDAMMYAYINRARVKLDLNYDDITGIQEIYGAKTPIATAYKPFVTNGPKTTFLQPSIRKVTVFPSVNRRRPANRNQQNVITTRRPSVRPTTFKFAPTSNPYLQLQKQLNADYCESLVKVDAVIKIDNFVYFFWKSLYFKSNGAVEPGYPRPISRDWSPLPDNIDAALYWPQDGNNAARILFFKDSHIWIFNKYKNFLEKTTIGVFFYRQLPDHIDSAFIRPSRGGRSQTYFTQGGYYYTTETHNVRGINGPYPTLHWNFPSGFDAAFTYDTIATYFFVGSGYYAADALDSNIQVNFRYYPRRTVRWWLSCF